MSARKRNLDFLKLLKGQKSPFSSSLPSTSLHVTPKRIRLMNNDVVDCFGKYETNIPQGLKTPKPSTSASSFSNSSDLGCTSPESRTYYQTATDTIKISSACFPRRRSTIESPLSESRVVATEEDDLVPYNMNHRSRGKCIIFNNEHFDNLATRKGSTNDALRIQKTFHSLGFHVYIHENLKHSGIVEKINELSKEDHSERDCLCIFMLTHGSDNDLIWARDVAYNLDTIWKPFTADKCKSLAGKPKLFFFQTCRGTKLDAGAQLADISGLNTCTDSEISHYRIPTHADFLLAHSTVQGFYSWRNPLKGTWYIQTLCDVIKLNYKTMDLLKMLTLTARKVAVEFESYNDVNLFHHHQKQMPSLTSMLVRDLYFG